jgi:hypothetical protein
METASTLYFWPPSQASRPIIPRLRLARRQLAGLLCCCSLGLHPILINVTIAIIAVIIIIITTTSPLLQLTGMLFMAQRRIVQYTRCKVQGCPPQYHPQPMTLSPSPINHDAKRRERWPILPRRTCFVSSSPGALSGKRVACPACHSPEWQRSQVRHSRSAAPNVTPRY